MIRFLERIAFPLLLALLFLPACAQKHWLAPGVEGRVVDGKTGLGIEGVEIWRDPANGPPVLVGKTGIDGMFNAAALRKTIFRVPFGDPIRAGTFRFSRSGYRDLVKRYGLFASEVVDDAAPLLKEHDFAMEPTE